MTQEFVADPVVARLLNLSDPTQAKFEIERLVATTIRPTVSSIVRHELVGATGSLAEANDDIDDVTANAIASVVQKIGELQSGLRDAPISDLRGYSARCAYNACSIHFRQRYPVRARIAAQVRATLRGCDALARWTGPDGRPVAGRAVWTNRPPEPDPRKAKLLQERIGDAASIVRQKLDSKARPIDTVIAVFEWFAAPILLSTLIALVAEVRGEKDLVRTEDPEGGEDGGPVVERAASEQASPEEITALRETLRNIWIEVTLLPIRQAQALLLNFRDHRGNGMLELLIIASVATIGKIAGVLGWTEDELRQAWPELPWEDIRIATYLGGTTTDVSNLRSVARRRIERRLGTDA